MENLGKEAKDKITGFTGIITGKCVYLYGCTQYCLVPKADKGTLKNGQWFDEGRIEITGNGILPKEVKSKKNGGPNMDAPQNIY